MQSYRDFLYVKKMREIFRAAAKKNPAEFKNFGRGTHGSAEFDLVLEHYKQQFKDESDAMDLAGRDMEARDTLGASGTKENGNPVT